MDQFLQGCWDGVRWAEGAGLEGRIWETRVNSSKSPNQKCIKYLVGGRGPDQIASWRWHWLLQSKLNTKASFWPYRVRRSQKSFQGARNSRWQLILTNVILIKYDYSFFVNILPLLTYFNECKLIYNKCYRFTHDLSFPNHIFHIRSHVPQLEFHKSNLCSWSWIKYNTIKLYSTAISWR